MLEISGAVQCLHTENTQIRPVVTEVQSESGPTYVPSVSSSVVLSGTTLTRGDVMWIVRVRIDLVLVTAMAASPGHWLTVYVPAEISY